MYVIQDEEDAGEAALEEEDLYSKAESEFWSIINQEKKNIEKKKDAEADKGDQGKVGIPHHWSEGKAWHHMAVW